MKRLKGSINVINFDSRATIPRQIEMFPNILRCGIFGPSGTGKSNILLTILLHMKPFQHIYLCSRTGYQEKYKLLNELIYGYNRNKMHKINFRHLNVDNLPQPEQIEKNSIIIFDDILTENQNNIANFFLRGRHRDISCFYLSQAYTKIPKKTGIRENFNYLILFKQDLVNLRQIYTEYVTDMDFNKFRNLCNICWKEPYGFLVIDEESNTCKYKKNFEFSL